MLPIHEETARHPDRGYSESLALLQQPNHSEFHIGKYVLHTYRNLA